jgi:hypothetical protein
MLAIKVIGIENFKHKGFHPIQQLCLLKQKVILITTRGFGKDVS